MANEYQPQSKGRRAAQTKRVAQAAHRANNGLMCSHATSESSARNSVNSTLPPPENTVNFHSRVYTQPQKLL